VDRRKLALAPPSPGRRLEMSHGPLVILSAAKDLVALRGRPGAIGVRRDPSSRRGASRLRMTAPLIGLLALLGAAPAGAQDGGWRITGGATAFRWLTDGVHGHTQDCTDPSCDDADWQRANLDNAIGWRLGAERRLASFGRLHLLAGGELEVAFSEYNSSQRNFTLGALLVAGGAQLDLGAVRPLLHIGAGGAAASGGRAGGAGFVEAGLDIVLSREAALRLAVRRAELAGPRMDEASILVVASPGEPAAWTSWEVGWAWGGSWPGELAGKDLALTRAPLWRLGAYRGVGSHGDRVGVELGATAQESSRYSALDGVPGNQRGRWVVDLGARWERVFAAEKAWRWRLGAGAKVGGWRDDGPLLVDESGASVQGGTELGLTASAGADLRLGRGLRLTTDVEQVYWPALGLGEARVLVGLAASAGSGEKAPASAPSPAHEQAGGSFGSMLLSDLGALAVRPAHLDGRDWVNLGVSALAIGGTMVFDERIRDEVQSRRSASGDDFFNAIRPLGNLTGPALLLGGLWLGGSLGDDPTLAAIGRDGVEASIFSVVLITPALKTLAGRARPDEGLGSTWYDPFSSHDSFPSGEAAQAFTIAAVVAAHTDSVWVEGLAWGVAGLLGYGRIYLDRHWASDVVTGALIGAGVGHWVAHRPRRNGVEQGTQVSVVPIVGHRTVGVAGSVSF
jgi:membrane-associated phospholipid phosphatase